MSGGYRQPGGGFGWRTAVTIAVVLMVGGLMYSSPRIASERQHDLGTIVAGTGHNASYAK
ncbi:MAG: hypothetical protein ACRYG4_04055 [Janthinobacterium lividum]